MIQDYHHIYTGGHLQTNYRAVFHSVINKIGEQTEKKLLEGDGYIHGMDCGDSFTDIFLSPSS